MYITVPLKLQKQKMKSKQHQKLLFKQIQYKKIDQQLKNEEELRKINQKITIKKKISLTKDKQNLPKRPISCMTLRPYTSYHKKTPFKPTHRPSMTSINELDKQFSSIQDSKIQHYSSNSEKNQSGHQLQRYENNFFVQNNLKNEQQKIEQNNEINTFSSKQELQKRFRQNFAKSLDLYIVEKQPIQRKKIKTTRRKNMTVLDLKVKKIQSIMKNVGKQYKTSTDLSLLVHKDQQKITQFGWKSFYNAVDKVSKKANQSNFRQEKLRLKRTAASDHLKNVASANNSIVHKIFSNEKNGIINAEISMSKTDKQKTKQSSKMAQKKESFTQENMFQFFNFVKGAHQYDQYSKQVSLREYRKHLQKFQLLKNSQRVIKQTQDYKNITMENFVSLNKDELLAYVYLNQNEYKLRAKQN